MIRYGLFFLVILAANIIQGITGFAGTILAMPPSLILVGYSAAKPVLNVLALFSGLYIFLGNRKSVDWKELRKVLLWMVPGIGGGILLQAAFLGKEAFLYKALGLFVIFLAVQRFLTSFWGRRKKNDGKGRRDCSVLLLPAAGVVHGIFVSGGPLLIGYLTRRLPDKRAFRSTISTVWVFLNTLILFDDVRTGLWNPGLLKVLLAAVPFLLWGMYIGSRLYKKMSQELFMKLTYALLLISGISLLAK